MNFGIFFWFLSKSRLGYILKSSVLFCKVFFCVCAQYLVRRSISKNPYWFFFFPSCVTRMGGFFNLGQEELVLGGREFLILTTTKAIIIAATVWASQVPGTVPSKPYVHLPHLQTPASVLWAFSRRDTGPRCPI